MSYKTVKPENIAAELAIIIGDYTEEVVKAIEKEVDDTAKLMLEDIKANAPKRTGKYAKGFKIKKEKRDGEIKRIIYNKDKPGLVHLTELGHAKRGGKGRVGGKPHLRPAYDKYIPVMESNIGKIIQKGGK